MENGANWYLANTSWPIHPMNLYLLPGNHTPLIHWIHPKFSRPSERQWSFLIPDTIATDTDKAQRRSSVNNEAKVSASTHFDAGN